MISPKYIIAALKSEDEKGEFTQIVKLRPYTAVKFGHDLYNEGHEIKEIPEIKFAYTDWGANRLIDKMKKKHKTEYFITRFD